MKIYFECEFCIIEFPKISIIKKYQTPEGIKHIEVVTGNTSERLPQCSAERFLAEYREYLDHKSEKI